MLRFIPAEELKKSFNVFGHFYSVQLPSDEIVSCRSVLEIVEKSHAPENNEELSIQQPNAVFIMMNPGSSKPMNEVKNQIQAEDIEKLAVSLVLAQPDPTQYQVMRVMSYRQWSHVRVLNLSDLCSPKSAEFYKLFRRLEEESDFHAHSIFSPNRSLELLQNLPSNRYTPLIFAWGMDKKLTPLIQRCLATIPNEQLRTGVCVEGSKTKYRHPLPSLQHEKQKWVKDILAQFRKS